MRLRKILVVLMLMIIVNLFVSCDYIPFFRTTSTETTVTTTLPSPVNGTISFSNESYDTFSIYASQTYSLTNISAYNDVLLATQDHIRHANIQIDSSLYEEQYLFSWSDRKTKVYKEESKGSGFIFMEDDEYYYALTNYHVVDPGIYLAEYKIKTLEDDNFSDAILVASDPDLDLAVVKFLKKSRVEVEFIDIYERLFYKYNLGELVLAIGNPLDVTYSVSIGEFKNMQEISIYDYDVLYHDAKIEEGSSGGALVDVDGNLLGINTWGYDSESVTSLAIPNYIVYMFLVNQGILE